jgi:DNA-binding CsgD family transcriptional regulator
VVDPNDAPVAKENRMTTTGPPGELGDVLLERDRELERIGACLERAKAGQGGALVMEGPAGIGKTVLLAAARDAAFNDDFRVLRARGAELERGFAFGVVRQLVEPMVAAASEDERALLLAGPPGVAARLLGLPGLSAEASPPPPQDPFDPSFAVLHGLYWLCANLATERPLALVIDDAHWADGASLRFLAFLMPRLQELHLALLLGARPAEAEGTQGVWPALTMDPAAEVVTVAPLSVSGVAALVESGTGTEPEPAFALACWEATRGTPFLVRMLVEALLEERVKPVTASAACLQNLAAPGLGRWATLLLTRLGSNAAQLARSVAVMERAELDQVARLAGLALTDAARAADRLVRAGVLDEHPLGFAHPLLRAAVYRNIAIDDRADAHRRAAKILAKARANPARVAEHLLVTVPAEDAWAFEQLRSASRAAAASGAPESAAAYLRRALSEPAPADAEGEVLLDLGLAEFSAGQSGWYGHLKAAVEAASNDATRVAAAMLFANALRWHERAVEAVKVCDSVAARLDSSDTERRLTLEAMAVACGVFDATMAPVMADRTNALLDLATERSLPRQCLATVAYVAALVNRPAEQVADLLHRSLVLTTRRGLESRDPLFLPNAAFRHPSAVVTLLWAERFEEAQSLADAAVAEAEASANGIILPAVRAQRAWLALQRGDLTTAEADARALLEAPGPSAPALLSNRAISVLTHVALERGDLRMAEQALGGATTSLAGKGPLANVLRYAQGHLRFAQGRFAEALSDFRAASAIAIGGVPPSPTYLPWRSDAALAALALGDLETARILSDEEVRLARHFGGSRALGVALRAAGIVSGGEPGEALLREAIEVLASRDTRLEQARAQTDLGALLRRRNRRVDSRELLRQALDTAYHLGAGALAERAETELRATGAKPRRASLTGLDALTACERRVAELAAAGMTNREIAQALFVTSRTVEGHLTNVFTKLELKTRTALPEALTARTQAART